MARRQWRVGSGIRTRKGIAIGRACGLGFVAALLFSAAAAPASAQEEQEREETEAGEALDEVRQRMEEARERLQLSDEQVEQLLPILMESFEGTMAVLSKHGIDPRNRTEEGANSRLNLRRLRALGRDLDEVREAMFDTIEEKGFLDDEQFAEFRKIQEEQRAALRERLRARRGM